MGNHPHPLMEIVSYLKEIKTATHKIAIRDGEYDPQERTLLRLIEMATDHTEEVQYRDRLGDLIKKGGDLGSAYMNRHAAPLGIEIVLLDDYRDAPRVVPFQRKTDELA